MVAVHPLRLHLSLALLGAGAGVLPAQGGRPVASVTVTPTAPSVLVGGSITLTATAFDRSGRALPGRTFTWSSGNPALATVSGGVVTALAVGRVSITATTGGQNGMASVTVTVPAAVSRPGIPSPHVGLPLPVVSVGERHHCVLGGGGAVACWGSNSYGELGDGTTTNRITPVAAGAQQRFQAVAVGANHTCGLLMSGVVACWGDNAYHQLGSNPARSSSSPIVVSTQPFRSLSVGGNHACAVMATGVAYCWGANDLGQLGNFSAASNAPVPVTYGIPFSTISAGAYHTCAVGSGTWFWTRGAVYCWGWDDAGQLGEPLPTDRCQPNSLGAAAHCSKRPVQVPTSTPSSSVSAGYAHTCGVDGHGTVWCWGDNRFGQLGNGSFASSSTPVAAASPLRFTSVSAGRHHTCGVATTGAAFCWGADSSGQLGGGVQPPVVGCVGGGRISIGGVSGKLPCAPLWVPPSDTAVVVAGGLRFASVSAGGNSTCGVTTAGAVYCWGEVVSSREPVRLSGWP